ncbi:hypothetical protein B0T26DRAFT_734639 [Lasiosphaeria miniovina]|uniref:Uncharacterized protein n=1 Tax=Lasiosphaeria miniovina TaxID=1954250 RepID=A0AA40DJ37_9PEZI|nr:uncharacterized protein B0T26DRAFT_734639 [Lasiosphaeria miniovina]KAK0701793.1 hypothetical protein B0T26DRAFT_734639 [Lasiosphaeria miniovina]
MIPPREKQRLDFSNSRRILSYEVLSLGSGARGQVPHQWKWKGTAPSCRSAADGLQDAWGPAGVRDQTQRY